MNSLNNLSMNDIENTKKEVVSLGVGPDPVLNLQIQSLIKACEEEVESEEQFETKKQEKNFTTQHFPYKHTDSQSTLHYSNLEEIKLVEKNEQLNKPVSSTRNDIAKDMDNDSSDMYSTSSSSSLNKSSLDFIFDSLRNGFLDSKTGKFYDLSELEEDESFS
jgi:hypothetical protein